MRELLDDSLRPVVEKVEAGERLSLADGLALYRSKDIFTIGRMADHVRRRLHGRKTYYVINRHVNYTNYCVLRCKFCGFRRQPGTEAPDAYTLSAEEVIEQAQQAYADGATEIHIVGGLHPHLPFDYYKNIVSGIRAACPRIAIKAFTAVEIVHFARMSRPKRTVQQVLAELKDCGLDCLPGGGAEIFDPRVHEEAFRHKIGEEDWFTVHEIAHEMGIPSNATMLYGHIESPEQRLRHLIKLREHQDASLRRGHAAFGCMVPLSFVPDQSEWSDLPGPSGLDDLKTLAISRLMLDNFPHIKAFWPIQSVKLSQVALSWGVDDFDGTVVWYDIAKREGVGRSQQLSVRQIRRLIAEAGFEPVERDGFYRPVARTGEQWRPASD